MRGWGVQACRMAGEGGTILIMSIHAKLPAMARTVSTIHIEGLSDGLCTYSHKFANHFVSFLYSKV